METVSPASSYADIAPGINISRCSLQSCDSQPQLPTEEGSASHVSPDSSLTCPKHPLNYLLYDSPSDYDHSRHDSVTGLNDSVAMMSTPEDRDHESGTQGMPTSYPTQKEAITVTTAAGLTHPAMGLTPNDRLGVMEINKGCPLQTYSMSERCDNNCPQAKGSDTSCEDMSMVDETSADQRSSKNLKKIAHPTHRIGNVTVIKDSLENVFVNVHMAMPDMRDHDGGSGHIPSYPRSKESITWTDDNHLSRNEWRADRKRIGGSSKDTQQEPANFDVDDAYPESVHCAKGLSTKSEIALQGSSVDGPSYKQDEDEDNDPVSESGDDMKIKFVAGKVKDKKSITITNHKDLKKVVAKADWRKSRNIRNNARGIMSQRTAY